MMPWSHAQTTMLTIPFVKVSLEIQSDRVPSLSIHLSQPIVMSLSPLSTSELFFTSSLSHTHSLFAWLPLPFLTSFPLLLWSCVPFFHVGVVSNWDNMEKYLQRCIYQYLRADPEEHYFLMVRHLFPLILLHSTFYIMSEFIWHRLNLLVSLLLPTLPLPYTHISPFFLSLSPYVYTHYTIDWTPNE